VTRRTGDDLEIEVPLARDLARHGGSIRVPGRDGEIEVRIPRRTRDQDEVRLEGLGFARPIDADLPAGGESYRTGMKHGDAIVRWRVPPGPLGSLSPQTITAGVILAAGIAVAVGIGRC
jgi:DnaJ-class molecular chaperone